MKEHPECRHQEGADCYLQFSVPYRHQLLWPLGKPLLSRFGLLVHAVNSPDEAFTYQQLNDAPDLSVFVTACTCSSSASSTVHEQSTAMQQAELERMAEIVDVGAKFT